MVACEDKSVVGGKAGSCSRGPLQVARRYWNPAGIANARICHSLVECGQNYTCYTIYTPSYFILLHCSPITMHLSPLLRSLLLGFLPPCFGFPAALPALAPRSSLTSLPSPTAVSAASISYIYYHHQRSPIHHPTATYIVARNAESYSVSLDSLKQVLMSCTPIPRSSPTAYPLATEHSSATLMLPSAAQSPSSDY